MKLTVRRELPGENDFSTKFVFEQEGMPGLTLSQFEIEPFTRLLETIEKDSIEFFWQSIGVHRQVESVTIVVRHKGVDEVQLKLTHGKAQKLASSLRASFPEYF